jgi:hypothetical protein
MQCLGGQDRHLTSVTPLDKQTNKHAPISTSRLKSRMGDLTISTARLSSGLAMVIFKT